MKLSKELTHRKIDHLLAWAGYLKHHQSWTKWDSKLEEWLINKQKALWREQYK